MYGNNPMAAAYTQDALNNINSKMSDGVWWQGANGHIYAKAADLNGVVDYGTGGNAFAQAQYKQIADPNPPKTDLGATTDTAGANNTKNSNNTTTVDPNAARRAQLLESLQGKRQAVEDAYNSLFGGLDGLVKERSGQLNTQYDQQFKKASQDFADVMPTIDSSYAALGSYDSTQRGDSRGKAEKGYENTVATIGQNKTKDEAALGQYQNQSKAKFQADKDAALRYIDSAPGTTDVQALQDANNNLDANLSQTGVTKASLGTDASAANDIKGLTNDNGRFQSALDSLDAVIKSSMPDSVKQAAVEAVSTAGGLSAQDKAKIQAQYGNVYAEQNKL